MKNDPTFKFLAAVIVAGLIVACFNHVPYARDHLISPSWSGATGKYSLHQFKDAAKALIDRVLASHA